MVMLNPITMNLADGRYLKVGVALQLAAEPEGKVAAAKKDTKAAEAGDGDGSASDPVWARALDATITELGGRGYSELASPDARRAAKDALRDRIASLYPDKVTGIYFTEFVMQ
jgi:flagellar FliL protein